MTFVSINQSFTRATHSRSQTTKSKNYQELCLSRRHARLSPCASSNLRATSTTYIYHINSSARDLLSLLQNPLRIPSTHKLQCLPVVSYIATSISALTTPNFQAYSPGKWANIRPTIGKYCNILFQSGRFSPWGMTPIRAGFIVETTLTRGVDCTTAPDFIIV